MGGGEGEGNRGEGEGGEDGKVEGVQRSTKESKQQRT